MQKSDLAPIIDFIHKCKPQFQPKVALILGSGLGDLADQIQNATTLPFKEIPHFPTNNVQGHKGQLVLGELGNVPVACMQGRIHSYEGAESHQFKIFIRTLKLLGCDTLFITNAAGSLREDMQPGQLALITDHINIHHCNPLIGPNDEEFGPRFYDMTHVYDEALRQKSLEISQKLDIPLHQGIYMSGLGPHFETPAEIRAFRLLGADLIGMSTIPEVLIARHCMMRILAISSVTNLAAGMTNTTLSHEETLHFGKIAAINLSKLITSLLENLSNDPC